MNLKKLITGNNGIFSIQRFFIIGATIFTSKVVLILIAYFFNEVQYNTFNQAYYTASILIIFGAFGFNYAVNRVDIKFILVFFASIINILITLFVLLIFSPPQFSSMQIISVIAYALFAAIGGIFTFQVLFQGFYKTYFYLTLLSAVLHIALIPAVMILNVDIFLALPFVTFFWFVISFPKFIKGKSLRLESLKELYKIGSANFIINSSVPLALVVDKYFVNHYFSLETANAYTFSWSLTAPMFYIGNLIEKIIYSSEEKEGKRIFKRSLLILASLIILYAAFMLAVVYFFPSLLPRSVNVDLMKAVFSFMIAGYALYVIFQFPVNGYLFKFKEVAKQKSIAVVYAVFIFLLVTFYLFFLNQFHIENFRVLLLSIWGFIFCLLIIKSYVVFGKGGLKESMIAGK